MSLTVALGILLSLLYVESHSTWCGKYYELGAPRTAPDQSTYFKYPDTSEVTLLDFRCYTASSLYLPDDSVWDPPKMIFDASITDNIGQPYHGYNAEELQVQVELKGTILLTTTIKAGTTGHMVDLPLERLETSLEPRTLRCTARVGDSIIEDATELSYLPPNPWGGSTIKLDRRTGALWVKKEKAGWDKTIPFGWYDSFNPSGKPPGSSLLNQLGDILSSPFQTDNFGHRTLITNRDRLVDAKSRGFNLIHPVPPGPTYSPDGDDIVIKRYLDDAHNLDIGVMYDMRHSFTNLDLVKEQVIAYRGKPGIHIWYTADEPDGPGDPLDATVKARNLIRHLDPYHPVALVLNCYDHNFQSYASGADILLTDVYSIAMNPLYSKKWSIEVTPTFGCSGCDGCRGNFYDLPKRIEEWRQRIRIMGRSRTMPVWVVPQAFDDQGEEFWWRVPEGREAVVQVVLAINHGAMGSCAWLASSATKELLGNASFIASHISAQTRFLADAAATRQSVMTTIPHDGSNGLDVSAWTIRHDSGEVETLILAAQMNYVSPSGTVDFGLIGVTGKIKKVLFGEVSTGSEGGVEFRMGRTSVAGVILSSTTGEEEDGLGRIRGELFAQIPLGTGI